MRPESCRPDPDREEDEVRDAKRCTDLEHELVVLILGRIALILRLFLTFGAVRGIFLRIPRSDLKLVPIDDLRAD